MKRPWFDLIRDPRPEDIDLDEIAHSLAMLCRFNGHVKYFYSVAQHSVHVSQLVKPKHAMPALFHDSPEHITGDIITPIKRIFRRFYSPIEDRVMAAVIAKFHFRMGTRAHVDIKRADNIMVVTEARDVSRTGMLDRWPDAQPLPMKLNRRACMSPRRAKKFFLDRFEEIQRHQNG